MRAEPKQTCAHCGASVTVDYYARGFPPDAAKRKLVKLCKAAHPEVPCDPRYTAGYSL